MTALLYLLPALFLLGVLLLGHYPGERLLLAVARRRPGRPVAPAPPPRRYLLFWPPTPRGGALLGSSLAGRAPPRSRRFATQSKRAMKGTSMRFAKTIAAALACAGLALPASAAAHVTLQPEEAPEGAYVVLDVRVPNESERADTTKVAVQFPPGFASASYQAVPGWKVKVEKTKLATPIQTEDGPVTEGIREMVFSGGALPPGEFQDFPLSLQIPGKAGQKLTFKAVQTYSDGEVVRWIGLPDSEYPAPQVLVTPAGKEGEGAPVANTSQGTNEPPLILESDDGGSGNGLAIAALVVGALGLLAGGAALVVARRRTA